MKCFFGHKFSKWIFVKEVNRIDDELHRTCKKCGRLEKYIGMTEECIVTGEKSPYTYKCD